MIPLLLLSCRTSARSDPLELGREDEPMTGESAPSSLPPPPRPSDPSASEQQDSREQSVCASEDEEKRETVMASNLMRL